MVILISSISFAGISHISGNAIAQTTSTSSSIPSPMPVTITSYSQIVNVGFAKTVNVGTLSMDTIDKDSLTDKGVALRELGNHTGAIQHFDKVLAVDPNETDALYNKGFALDSLGIQ